MNIRPAFSTDADSLAYLTNLSSEGMSGCIWEHLAEGDETPLQAGARLIAKDSGIFSFHNTTVIAQGHQVFALITGRHLQGSNLPVRLDDFLPFIRPLIQLETKVQDTWNITALAVDENMRHRGMAMQLLEAIEQKAQVMQLRKLSIAVASENTEGCSLCQGFGFQVTDEEEFIRFGNLIHNGKWLMMVKDI